MMYSVWEETRHKKKRERKKNIWEVSDEEATLSILRKARQDWLTACSSDKRSPYHYLGFEVLKAAEEAIIYDEDAAINAINDVIIEAEPWGKVNDLSKAARNLQIKLITLPDS